MIIVCPECSTKFNINPERIPEGGAKVRCARCKNIFLADKNEDLDPPVSKAEHSEAPSPPGAMSQTDQDNFSYERFRELDTRNSENDFTFTTEDQKEEVTSGEDPDDFSFDNAHKGALPSSEELPIHEHQATAADSAEDPFESFVSEISGSDKSRPAKKQKKSGIMGTIISIVLLLILAALILTGIHIYINGPEKINQVIQQFFVQESVEQEQQGQITLQNLEGKFIQNEQVGELFLIRGEAVNNYSQPRSAVQVKGIIYDQSGEPILQKTVFCGNPITDEQLQTLPFDELEKMMGNQFGKELSNMKVNRKQSIQFDIVFKDLPKNLAEFSVNVTSSKPASN